MSKKAKTHPVPELRFELNRLSGDGRHYKTFIASLSKAGTSGDMVLCTPDCSVTVRSSSYHIRITTKLLEETLAKALADGSVSVTTNYRPAGKQLEAYTSKTMTELMDIVVDNINVLVYIEKLTLQPRLNA